MSETATLEISTIADAVILEVADGDRKIWLELSKKEALDIAGALAVAIHRIGRGETVAGTLDGLIDCLNSPNSV